MTGVLHTGRNRRRVPLTLALSRRERGPDDRVPLTLALSRRETGPGRYRLPCSALLAAAMLVPTVGCSSASRPLDAVAGIIPGSNEAAFRKKVEADNFPTANQAGIH